MITWTTIKTKEIDNGVFVRYGIGYCLSTDQKPTNGIYNGSKLTCIDTSENFLFDASAKTWVKQKSSSGGDDDEPSGNTASNSEIDSALDNYFPGDGTTDDSPPSGNTASNDEIDNALDSIFGD